MEAMMVKSRQKPNEPGASALLVASPGRRLTSLLTLLRATPRVRILGPVNDEPSAVRLAAARCPDWLVLDASLPDDEAWSLLRRARIKCPQTRCIVLVSTSRQQQMAEGADADVVLVNGFSVNEFFAMADGLMDLRQDQCKEW